MPWLVHTIHRGKRNWVWNALTASHDLHTPRRLLGDRYRNMEHLQLAAGNALHLLGDEYVERWIHALYLPTSPYCRRYFDDRPQS